MKPSTGGLFETVQLAEWRARLTAFVAGLFLVEALTGLVIYFAPFSVTAQVAVVLHTIAGLLFAVPYGVYQVHHWRLNAERPFNQHKLLGYLCLVALAVCGVSGLVLTWQASMTPRISYTWDLVHLVSGLASTAFVVWHIGIILLRHRWQDVGPRARQMLTAQGVFLRRSAWITVASAALIIVWTGLSPMRPIYRDFPNDYVLPFGDNPFAPSLAMTSTGQALDPLTLAGSEGCGASNCHADVVEEWEPSAHRYAAMSPFFQGVQAAMAANNGPESTRYCGGCHDPIALFSGSKNLYSDDLSAHGYKEGISCVACHSIERTDVRGNANYTIAPQPRYLYEEADDPILAWMGRFVIRAYPKQHMASWTRDLYKTPEFCGACHKQFIDEEINNVGWVQLQNQYDNWKASRWHVSDDPQGSITCRECHMPLVTSTDPAAGDALDYNRTEDDGKHRSHRFIGGNQHLPGMLDLPSADEQVRLTEAWLRGETEIPEIADKWTVGPAVPLQILAPETAAPGEPIKLQVIAVNNKAGHDFPTGPLDIIQAWIEVVVEDDHGNIVFESGRLDADNYLPSGTTVFKAEAVDQFGNRIDKHNLWEMVGARFKRTLFPGYSDIATYAFAYPDPTPEGTQALHVTARLRYRKVEQYLIDYLFPDSGLTAPVTDMSEAAARITVSPNRPD
jgi:hypothetical protein